MSKRIAIYPGTFDPLTLGHQDIIRRASHICDELIVGVAENSGKNPLFSTEERINIASQVIEEDKKNGILPSHVTVKGFDRLLTDFARAEGASLLVRGLRAVSDFEYEFQMASANKRLHSELETIFLMAPETQHFVASRLVKEVATFGGDISSFVPERVAAFIASKLGK